MPTLRKSVERTAAEGQGEALWTAGIEDDSLVAFPALNLALPIGALLRPPFNAHTLALPML